MAQWNIKLNNSAFEPIGEFVGIRKHKVDVALNKTRTFQMDVRLDNPLAPYIAVNSGLQPIYFEVIRDGIELFNGALMTMQETGQSEGGSLTINAAGPEAVFASRLVATATATEQLEGIKFAAGVQHAIRFKELLDVSNKLTSGETHIDYTSGKIESTATSEYTTTSFRTLAEVLQDLYNQAEGFDWMVTPQKASASKIGILQIKDLIGSTKPNSVFEYGERTRNNVVSYTRTVDVTNLMNRGWNVSSAGPEATGSPTIKQTDTEALEKWGLHEYMVPLSALNISMREAIVKEALQYRRKPRQTIAFQPTVNDETGKVPQFEQDFGPGDTFPFRVNFEEAERFNVLMRCWGASFAVDENGKEVQSILVSEE